MSFMLSEKDIPRFADKRKTHPLAEKLNEPFPSKGPSIGNSVEHGQLTKNLGRNLNEKIKRI